MGFANTTFCPSCCEKQIPRVWDTDATPFVRSGGSGLVDWVPFAMYIEILLRKYGMRAEADLCLGNVVAKRQMIRTVFRGFLIAFFDDLLPRTRAPQKTDGHQKQKRGYDGPVFLLHAGFHHDSKKQRREPPENLRAPDEESGTLCFLSSR